MVGPLKVPKQYRELSSVSLGWVQDLSSLLATKTKAQGSTLPAKVHEHSYFFFNLYIYFWLHWVLAAAQRNFCCAWSQ